MPYTSLTLTHCLTHSHRKNCSIKDKRVDLMPSCVLSQIYLILIELIFRRFILEPWLTVKMVLVPVLHSYSGGVETFQNGHPYEPWKLWLCCVIDLLFQKGRGHGWSLELTADAPTSLSKLQKKTSVCKCLCVHSFLAPKLLYFPPFLCLASGKMRTGNKPESILFAYSLTLRSCWAF